MNPEMNFQLTPNENGQVELVLREGAAVKVLDPKAPMQYNVKGTLRSVSEYLAKRIDTAQFKQKDCTIVVNREELRIALRFNERDEYTHGEVVGELRYHPDFITLGVNNGEPWIPNELALLFKMHRNWFVNIEDNMKIVTELKNFTANVNTKVEKAIAENGNRTDVFSQVVDSNLPPKITLNMPIVRGGKPVTFEVETFAKVDGKQVAFVLISPGAVEIVEDARNSAIDEEIAKISEIAPDIVIIEE